MKNNSAWAIVPAAGIGSRMQADRPKQYLLLDNKTVLEHTLERLASHPAISGIVIAVADNDSWWPTLQVELSCPVHVVQGGVQRSDSVLNALIALQDLTDSNPWVLVHDAARPCLRHQDIDQLLLDLLDHPVGGILGIPLTDTVKRVDAEQQITETVCRQGLWRAATPQMFRQQSLIDALQQCQRENFAVTDEAAALAFCGLQPKMVEGHADNIKITLPRDLPLATLFLQQQQEEQR